MLLLNGSQSFWQFHLPLILALEMGRYSLSSKYLNTINSTLLKSGIFFFVHSIIFCLITVTYHFFLATTFLATAPFTAPKVFPTKPMFLLHTLAVLARLSCPLLFCSQIAQADVLPSDVYLPHSFQHNSLLCILCYTTKVPVDDAILFGWIYGVLDSYRMDLNITYDLIVAGLHWFEGC